MLLNLIAQLEVLDTSVTIIVIDAEEPNPPTHSVWIRVKNNYNFPVDVYISPIDIPTGYYIADTLISENAILSLNCTTIPDNYKLKNVIFDRIGICTHGWISFLKPGDPVPTNSPGGYTSYNYYTNFLDDNNSNPLDTTLIGITSSRTWIYGVRKLSSDSIYKSTFIMDFDLNTTPKRIKKLAIQLEPGNSGLFTAIHMFELPLYKLGSDSGFWNNVFYSLYLFNPQHGLYYAFYHSIEFIDTTNSIKTIPPGGIDSFLLIVNILKLKQDQASRTYHSRYSGGFFIYRSDNPSSPEGRFTIRVEQIPFSNTFENNNRVSYVIPFKYQNGILILNQKGNYKIYDIMGRIIGVIKSDGNFPIKHLKPGVYIINYQNQNRNYKAIIR